MEIRYSCNQRDFKRYTTEETRKEFLIENLYAANEVVAAVSYTHLDVYKRQDITQRPEIAARRIEEGHWEGDTVVGKRGSKEAVVLSLLEKKTENYIAIRIPGKDCLLYTSRCV